MTHHRSYFPAAFIGLVWLLVALLCAVFLPHIPNPFKIGGMSDPKSESSLAKHIMTDKLPYGASRIVVLYESDKLTAHNPLFMKEVNKSLDGLKRFSLDYRILSPYENSQQISTNKHAAYAVVVLTDTADEAANSMKEFRKALGKPKLLNMLIGGEPVYISEVDKISEDNLYRGEIIAFPLFVIALVFIFRGLLAALLPLISGVLSIIIIITILYLLGHLFELSVFVINIATMLGLGLSIDYTLLITYRFREELAQGHTTSEAIRITLRTAGRSVFFSGIAVLVSMSSLLFFPVNILYSIGVGGVVVVVVSVMSALTFLPVVLYVLGKKVNAWSLPMLRTGYGTENAQHSMWFKAAKLVMKFPLSFFIPTVLFLLLLGYPFLNVKLGGADASILPAWTDSRQLADRLDAHFNANDLTPIEIVFKSKNKSILTKNNISGLYDFAEKLKKDPRVSEVTSIVSVNSSLKKAQYQTMYTNKQMPLDASLKRLMHETTDGSYTVMSVTSKYAANDQHTLALVKTIRNMPIDHQLTKQVAGTSAEIIDSINGVYSLFFVMIAVISIITYLVLLVLLRSILIPLQAIIMNFLSMCVCYGMFVYIFQEGHFASFLHFKPQGNTDLNLPIILFFCLFGLSMDYEVFLLTRIKEFYERTKDNQLSVALGVERSARIITSAALIVIIVTLAFVTADIVFIKAFGLGTALAVAVDATLIRILLVPATMRLLGNANWYFPKWLSRLLP